MRAAMTMLAVTTIITGCTRTTGELPAVTESEATKVATAAEATFTAGNVDAVMSQYDDKAVMIDPSAAEPSNDRKVTTGWAKTFVSMKPADFKVSGRHIQLLGPDAFVSSGVESFTVAAGTARPTVSARFTDVFKRDGGAWKIVHEHVSMPPALTVKP